LLRKESNGIVASGKGDNNVLEKKVSQTAQKFPDHVQNGRAGKV
jgi:hypothetical protein